MNNAGKLILGIIIVIILLAIIFTVGRNVDKEAAPMASTTPVAAVPISSSYDGTYIVDSSKSVLTWRGSKPFVDNYTDAGTVAVSGGSFTVAGGLAVGEVTLDMATIVATETFIGKNDGLTAHLKTVDFFDVEQFPTATFLLSALVLQAEDTNSYLAEGSLTMKGISQQISFPATISLSDNTAHVLATTTLDRTLWDIRFGSGKFFENLADNTIDDMFTVSLDVVANRAPSASATIETIVE
ncbi:MAG: lipid-binding protein [Candidatus Vogelbacteria bacterium CG10_big_fil_rev_8_21_14_0_10_51_16]|uniref:Lipid-binding protein n=1 Tax=Candidatus Vogelbacteria bacterium CG10_big_fil_rev_8_21_14_0_10_51_16 TaxID=1975045 RepID=A0A2H0REW3_9BACT|nr:MAG: lipid-binding protein [Candidatus Vogelbacteria bacterium CG10_big_fil_rev_8_21_14_0_10_51_16]